MKYSQEHPVILFYAMVFFALLAVSAYALLIQLQQERAASGEFELPILELTDPTRLF